MYELILRDVETAFASATWTSHNIKTIPDNYQGTVGSNSEYVIVKIMPTNSSLLAYGVEKQIDGMVAVKMFTKAGEGQGRIMAMANFIDIILENKTLPNGTKLGTSYLNVEGLDPQNKALYSASYIIPFTKYGE
jgi:hypothetical protein